MNDPLAGLWRVKLVADGHIHLQDTLSLDAGKEWAAKKLAALGHDVPIEWLDRESSSDAAPAPGLEVHVTARD